MPTFCAPIKFKHRGICAGDLNLRVGLNQRDLDAPNTGVDYGHTFTSTPAWAALETVKGKDIFAGTNINELVTHIFYIRYRDISAEWWVSYHGKLYDIIDIENFEERNEFLTLMCNIRGDSTQLVNEA